MIIEFILICIFVFLLFFTFFISFKNIGSEFFKELDALEKEAIENQKIKLK